VNSATTFAVGLGGLLLALLAGVAFGWMVTPPVDHAKPVDLVVSKATKKSDRLDLASSYVHRVADELPEMPVLPRKVPSLQTIVPPDLVEEEPDERAPPQVRDAKDAPRVLNDVCAKNHGRRENYHKHGRLMWRCAYD
jgi:hypothetical protein